ncbi:MAG TPA: site-2 protease family protein [Pirellulaceae bacterium]|jgi:stage IV sporulation protein FB|nr:site-2 protease family protein [Pirellulaceae bacterium]
MFNAWRVGRLFGIDIAIHWSFILLFGFLVYAQLASGSGAVATALHALLFLAVFACVLLHEFGHAMAARQFGIGTKDITLLPIGGVARLARMPEKPLQELWVAVAGPLVNVAIAALIFFGLLGYERFENLANPAFVWDGQFFRELMWINVALVAFNMLPAFPMDGGRVLRAFLAFFLPFVQATRVAAFVGQAFAVLIGILGLATGQFMLAVLAAFVFFAARGETQGVLMREAYRALPIGRATRRYFLSLPAEMRVEEAAAYVARTRQSFFPVVNLRNDVVAAVDAGELEQRAYGGDRDLPVAKLAHENLLFADEREPLWDVIERMQEKPGPVCVMRDGKLVGVFGPEELTRVMKDIREGRAPHAPSPESETPPIRRPPVDPMSRHWEGPLPRPLRDSSYPTGA